MHHIIQKNKRLVGGQAETKKRPPSGSSRAASFKSRQTSESFSRLMSTSKPEVKQILEAVSAIENDLRLRVQMYGQDSTSTIECLQHYVKTCNDHGVFLIKNAEFKAAAEILQQCEQLLVSNGAGNYPALKFQTYNNIAHCHNVQGNVRLSLKYLSRALEYGIEAEELSQGQSQLPIVETYLNIANANLFLGQLDQAVEQTNQAIYISQQQLDQVMAMLDDPGISPEQREQLGQAYHSQINLHVMSFQTKGQILEKMKRYEEAILEYQQGKQVIEANYGTQHPKYVELANAMNGAKLRTKYIQPSNILQGQFDNSRQMSHQQFENPNTINVITHDNVFLKEQEMMKPISQQKLRRKVLRPSSAKPPKQQSSSGSQRKTSITRSSSKGINQSTEQIYNSRALQSLNLQKQSSSGCEWHKNRSRSPKQTILPRKDFQIKIRPNSARKSRKVLLKNSQQFNDFRDSRTNSHIHDTSDCANCHSQLEEIRQMHIEQQRLMNTIMQNQLSSQSQQQIPPLQAHQQHSAQSQQQQQVPPHMQTPPNPFYQYPPPPYYYPYPMPPPQGMYPPMPYPYPYPPPPYQAPPPFASFSPTINNFLHSTQKSDGSHKHEQHPPYPPSGYPGFNLHQIHPHQPRYAQSNQDAQSITTLTELNERDSEFYDMAHRLNSARDREPQPPQITKEIANINIKFQPEQPKPETKIQEPQKKPPTKPKEVPKPPEPKQPEVDMGSLRKKMHEAAIKIQTYFRQYRFQRLYKLMTSLNKRKFLFHKQMIAYREDTKGKIMILNVSLISLKKGKKFNPDTVVFEFYKRKKKTLVMEVTHKIKAFGFNNPDKTNKVDVFNRVKAFLSQLRLKGQTLQSVKKQFLENVGVYDENYSKIEFMDPGYFNEGLQFVKGVKIEDRPKRKDSSSSDDKQESFREESIQDEYSMHEDIQEEVSDHEKSKELRKQKIEDDLDKIRKIIKIQSHIRRYLSNINLQYRIKGAKGGNLVYACVKRSDHYYLVKARILKNNFGQKTYSFAVSMKDNSKVKAFTLLLKTIPVQDLEIIDFIEKAIQIKYDDKAKVITSVSFDPRYKPESRSFEMNQDDVLYQQSLNAKQKMLVSMVTKDKPKMSIDRAVIIIQTRFRTFLAQKRRAQLIQQEVISSFIFRVGENVAHVMVKQENKKHKFEILVRNCKGKRKTTTVKTKDMPFERCFLEESLKQALEIKWNKDGSSIDKVKYDHKRVDLDKIKQTVQLQLQEIKDQRKEYEQLMREREVKKQEEVKQPTQQVTEEIHDTEEQIDEDVYSDHDFDKEEVKEEFKVNLEASTKGEEIAKNEIQAKGKPEEKKGTKTVSKKEQEKAVVKAQALVKGAVARNQVRPLMKKNHTMLMRVCRRLSNSKWYLIFLIKKPEKQIKSAKDGYYLITMRQADDLNEIYDLEITLEMAKKIFGKKEYSKQQLHQAVIYETNQHEFQLMLECLDIKEEDDFSLDFQKFRKLQAEKAGIQLFENTYAPVLPLNKQKPKQQQPLEESKELVMETPQAVQEDYSLDYDAIEEEASHLESSPDPFNKKQQISQIIKTQPEKAPSSKSKQLQKKEPQQSKETKAAITIQRRARKFLTKKQYQALNGDNFTNKDKDPKKKLALKEKGPLKLCDIYFMYFVYTDSYEQELRFTLKSVKDKITIVNLKTIALADFGEENLDAQDVIEYFKDKLTENEQEVMVDEKTGGIKKDWVEQLREFIDNNL